MKVMRGLAKDARPDLPFYVSPCGFAQGTGQRCAALNSSFALAGLAMKNGFGLNRILVTIHVCRALAEANGYAAGEWARAQVNARVPSFLQTVREWRRT